MGKVKDIWTFEERLGGSVTGVMNAYTTKEEAINAALKDIRWHEEETWSNLREVVNGSLDNFMKGVKKELSKESYYFRDDIEYIIHQCPLHEKGE